MSLQSVLTILSYATSSLILLIGVVLVTGWYLPDRVPENYRLTLGVIMILYSIYRIWLIRTRGLRKGDEGENGNHDA